MLISTETENSGGNNGVFAINGIHVVALKTIYAIWTAALRWIKSFHFLYLKPDRDFYEIILSVTRAITTCSVITEELY